jgi:porphobilinogen deaminase
MRGNVETRIKKMRQQDLDGIILALPVLNGWDLTPK